MAELAVLDEAVGERFSARRPVKQLERARVAGQRTEQPEVVGHRRERRIGNEPQIDPAGVGGHFGVGLDRAAGRESRADHLLAENIERGAHRGEDGDAGTRGQESGTSKCASCPDFGQLTRVMSDIRTHDATGQPDESSSARRDGVHRPKIAVRRSVEVISRPTLDEQRLRRTAVALDTAAAAARRDRRSPAGHGRASRLDAGPQDFQERRGRRTHQRGHEAS